MNTRIYVLVAALFGLCVPMPQPTYATPTGLEGTVRDANWKPVRNANLRIEAKSGKFSNTVSTDSKGHYAFDNLDAGTYRITLLVNGTVKAMIDNAVAKSGEARKLNFDLTGRFGAKATHMVYVPQETGSNLGGSWVEVDDNRRAKPVSVDNIETLGRYSANLADGSAILQLKEPYTPR